MRSLIATLIALMLFAATPVVAGDFEDGMVAYEAGDHKKAFRLWKPFAERGLRSCSTTLVRFITRAKASSWTKPKRSIGIAKPVSRAMQRRSRSLV